MLSVDVCCDFSTRQYVAKIGRSTVCNDESSNFHGETCSIFEVKKEVVRSTVLACDASKVLESRVMKDLMDDNGGERKHYWSSVVLHLLRQCPACVAVGL